MPSIVESESNECIEHQNRRFKSGVDLGPGNTSINPVKSSPIRETNTQTELRVEVGSEGSGLYRLASSALAMSPYGSGENQKPSNTKRAKHDLHSGENDDSSSANHCFVSQSSQNIENDCAPPRVDHSLTVSNSTMASSSSGPASYKQDLLDERLMKNKSVSSATITKTFEDGTNEGIKRQNHAMKSEKSQTDPFREIRMERKRKREMLRRSNVNKELDKLAELIMNMNPPELKTSPNNKYVDDNTHAPLNRLELIHVTVKVLERLHNQTEADANRINDLEVELNTLKEKIGNDKVTMMFPVMVPSKEQGNIGDPIPNGSIFVPPRIPNHFLHANPAPSLYHVPPFPANSFFPSFPHSTSVGDVIKNPPASVPFNPQRHPNAHEPHIVLLPDSRYGNSRGYDSVNNDLQAMVEARLALEIAKKSWK